MNERAFLGRGWKFPLQVDPKTGRIAFSEHEEDIREAVELILRTGRGERVMRPEFGTTMYEYAFAPSQHSARQSIAHEISEELILQEPRIVDVEVFCDEPDGQTGAIIVHVSYTVRSTNNRYNHVYPFYQTEQAEEA